MFAGCSDDPAAPGHGAAGSSNGGMAKGGATAGSSTTAGTPAAGSGGTAGGGAGGVTTGGGAGGTTAGTGGTPPVIVPTVFLIDNVRLQPRSANEGGAGGEGGGGVGGAPSDAGAPGTTPAAVGGAGGAAGAGGEGPTGPLPDFLLTFDTEVAPLVIHSPGFSPNVGGSGGPVIFDATTLTFEPSMGKTGGAAKVTIPFSVATQQADFSGAFDPAADLAGYELTADVKMTETGTVGECATVWMYVYGANGYANDKSGEPAMRVTSHVVKNAWTRVRLNLDGPYGFHTTPAFKPASVNIWGIQVNTWGCP